MNATGSARWFMPERYTPLYYTSVFERCSVEQRRSYNRLHLCYFHEQLAFLEGTLPETLLRPLLADPRFAELAQPLRRTIEQERRHAAMFRALNRELAPELYARSDTRLLASGALWGRIWRLASRRRVLWPTFLWFMLIQEEKALSYTRGFVAAEGLEPAVLAVHRRHLADETGHCDLDQHLLELCWGSTSERVLRLNGRLFGWMLESFFLAPRRSGWRVVEAWLAQCPELEGERGRLRRELRALDRDPEWVAMMYGPETLPISWRRMSERPELAPLLASLRARCGIEHGLPIRDPRGRCKVAAPDVDFL